MTDVKQATSHLEARPRRLRGNYPFATESEVRILGGGLVVVSFLMTAVIGGAHFALMSLT